MEARWVAVLASLVLTACDPVGPMQPLGPGDDDWRVLEALEDDPGAELAPHEAELDDENSGSGIESTIYVQRRYCSSKPLHDVHAFYARELPKIGWAPWHIPAAMSAKHRNYDKQVGGRDATLTVEPVDGHCVEVYMDAH